MKKLKEEVTKRFSEEITALKVSKSAIAKKIALTFQKYPNNALDTNLPGMLLMVSMYKKYPKFDTVYVIAGIRKEDNRKVPEFLYVDRSLKKELLARLVNSVNRYITKANNDQSEAMKLFVEKDYLFFILLPDLQQTIVSALKALEQNNVIACTWSSNEEYPLECQLTTQGLLFRDYLRFNEWDL